MSTLTHEKEGHQSWRDFVKGRQHMHDTKPVRGALEEWFVSYAFPGGYPVLYLNDSGDTFCAECAAKVFLSEGQDIHAECYYEGPSIHCDKCNKEIESAYGDPEDESA